VVSARGLPVSLLDGARDTVLIWPEIEVVDSYGTPKRVPGPLPYVVGGRVQPVSMADMPDDQTATLYRFITRDLPGGTWARVEWDGREWDVIGEPRRSNGSDRTRHASIVIRARTPQGV
jgi:hypothetical protein